MRIQVQAAAWGAAAALALGGCRPGGAGAGAPGGRDWVFGVGGSSATNVAAAVAEAAGKAKQALGGAEPKLVLVYDALKDAEGVMKGVARVFNPAVVYGCPGGGVLTRESNTGTIAVLAVAGDVQVVAASAELKDDPEGCGKRVGENLKPLLAGIPADQTRVTLFFGQCNANINDSIVAGVQEVLGENIILVGGAQIGDVAYYQGKAIPDSNIAVVLAGDFDCSVAREVGLEKEGVVPAARAAAERALEGVRDRAVFLFTFSCVGRMTNMGEDVPEELAAVNAVTGGDLPLFGFYAGGEIGHEKNGEPAVGVGGNISLCAILKK